MPLWLFLAATPKTVVRGGYGIFYGFLGTQLRNVQQPGFSQTTNVIPSLDNGLTFRVKDLSNPFVDGILSPAGSKDGLATNLGRSITAFDEYPLPPQNQRWQLSAARVARTLCPRFGVRGIKDPPGSGRNLDSTPSTI
jgi:hypothetical protein